MKIRIWVRSETRGVTAGPFDRTFEEWKKFFHLEESIQVKPFGDLFWADGRVTTEFGKNTKDWCSFVFNLVG